MDVKQAVRDVASKFVYREDKRIIVDHWSVMKERDGKLYGDCDDFALTVIWKTCDENILKFFWYVMILHKHRIYHAKTHDGAGHAYGYADGLYFDNWTLEALPKEEFFAKTKHRSKFFFPSPFMIVQLLVGLFTRR